MNVGVASPRSENLATINSIHRKAPEHLRMKITLIGHAAILVETRGLRILSDPWWQGPCFGAQWWPHPKPWLEPLSEAPPDFIYLSHGHADHFHPGTMRRMPKTAKVLVSARQLGNHYLCHQHSKSGRLWADE